MENRTLSPKAIKVANHLGLKLRSEQIFLQDWIAQNSRFSRANAETLAQLFRHYHPDFGPSTAKSMLSSQSALLYDDATKDKAIDFMRSKAAFSDNRNIVFHDGSVIESNPESGALVAKGAGEWRIEDIEHALGKQISKTESPSLVARIFNAIRGTAEEGNDTHRDRPRG